MAERRFDDGGDLGHAAEHRRRPRRRQHVNCGTGVALPQPHQERLHHHGITHP